MKTTEEKTDRYADLMVNAIDPDEAKAAVQADFERRVRECLD
jgi:hypothetical protein